MTLTLADVADTTGALQVLEALKQKWPQQVWIEWDFDQVMTYFFKKLS